MYLLINELEMSSTQVGRLLDGRDHATVIHGAGKINREINEDGQLRQDVLTIKEAIFTSGIAEPAKLCTEQPAVEEFRTILNMYGLEAKLSYFQQAIRLSFVSGGREGVELPDQDGQVLRQLGVGWPELSEYGLRIGRELTNSLIESKADSIEEILAFVPPRVVALFIQEAQPASRGNEDLYSLRIPEEERHGAVLSPLSSLLTHSTVRSLAVGLGNRLVELELATTHVGPAYRGAKWNATVFEFAGVVGQSIKRWLDDKETSLEPVERSLKQLELLRKFPIPSLQEFDSNGIGWEALVALLGTAMSRGIISEVVDQGPAFLILDQILYDQLVVTPVFNKLVDDILLDKLSSFAPTDLPDNLYSAFGLTKPVLGGAMTPPIEPAV
jgi:hypothetical protein